MTGNNSDLGEHAHAHGDKRVGKVIPDGEDDPEDQNGAGHEFKPFNTKSSTNTTSNSNHNKPDAHHGGNTGDGGGGGGGGGKDDFMDLLRRIGSQGPYQKFLLYAVMSPIVVVGALLAMNMIFMLYVPPHHCHVPGRPDDMSAEEWKNLTLPLEIGPDGRERFSQCEMYRQYANLVLNNGSGQASEMVQDEDSGTSGLGNAVPCQHGWNYDTSDYDNTMPTEYNWVCTRKAYATDVFSVGVAGNAVGQLVFGILADKVGRKPIFFVSLFILTFFKFVSFFVPHIYALFLVFTFLSGTGMPLMFASPSLISAEVCDNEYRAWVFSFTWMIWVAGMASMPLIAKISRDWFLIGMITTVPGLILFLVNIRIIPESPRWLLSVGRLTEAKEIILQIAKKNGTSDKITGPELDAILRRLHEAQSNGNGKQRNTATNGFWTLFKRKRLAKNTIMLTIAWSMNTLIYEGITLNTPNVGGIDQFLNFFILSIVEIPASMLGGYLLDKVGRRWTQVAFFALCSVACFVCALVVLYPEMTVALILLVIVAKFGVTLTFLVVFLQATELFPTYLRSTGYSVASTTGAVLGIFGPHIVFAGQFYVGAPYIMMGILAIIGLLAAMLLPETLNQNLPETLEDAVKFGKGHKFWSLFPSVQNLHAARRGSGLKL